MLNKKPKLLSFSDDVAAYLLMSNTPIIITGASGWLGQAVLEMCHSALGGSLIKLLTAFTTTAKIISLRSGGQVITEPFKNLEHKTIKNAFIFHCAFLTREQSVILGSHVYVEKNREITSILKTFISKNGSNGLFIPSSGAVYGKNRIIERDIVSNPYGVLKFEDEYVFGELAAQKNFSICIIRIFNLSGPFINKQSSYALASIIQEASKRGVVNLRSPIPVVRSYAHVEDVINIATKILYHKLSIAPIDTCGEISIELSDLASRILQIMNKPNIKIVRPEMIDDVPNYYVGDGKQFFSLSEKFGMRFMPLDDQISSTLQYLKVVNLN